jgi:hypothetical protein
MIRVKGTSFGYGRRIGLVHHFRGVPNVLAAAGGPRRAVLFESVPPIALLRDVAHAESVVFMIAPACSAYSHLGAAMWTVPVPTVAVAVPLSVAEGAPVFVDFDNGDIMAAESPQDARVLEALGGGSVGPNDGIMQSRVLAEAASAADVGVALNSRADGLSVVKAEQLFSESGVPHQVTWDFVRSVKAHPALLPLPVRFFDSRL